jgi:HTH-type transcriptional regulator / antitoxin HigA
MIRTIKYYKEYQNALNEIEYLISRDPDEGTEDRDKLELLSLLIEKYENENFHIDPPDPIDAIIFRMDQQDLNYRDLIPYIGSRSKVSEVLSRKRPLTISMIRALNKGLGIPANVLIQENNPEGLEIPLIEWDKFPIKEMSKRGWLGEVIDDYNERARDLLLNFFNRVGPEKDVITLYRQTGNIRSARNIDPYALAAWTAQIIICAKEKNIQNKYSHGIVNLKFMRDLVQLSVDNDGPKKAINFLENYGIIVIVEPHLQRTYIDGATTFILDNNPVIGLTIRYDRFDNFWFTLIHELAHVALHYNIEIKQFYDDLDYDAVNDPIENEADELASEALIPYEQWINSPASKLKSPDAAIHLAKKLNIHPSIVAGRMRFEFNAYRLLNNLIGNKQARKHFPDKKWN